MALTSVGSIADAIEDGHYHEQFVYKTGSPVLSARGRWYDLSMGAGIPRYNAYVGSQLEFTPLYGSGNNGIYTGEDEAGRTKYLTRVQIQDTTTNKWPGVFCLCDYLGFYPLVDLDNTDLQEFTQPSGCPRLPSRGASLMVVSTVPQTAGTASTLTINYTNQDGTSGRSTTCRIDTSSVLGQLVNCCVGGSAAGQAQKFVSLQGGDTGVRSVESVQANVGAGGFASVVLVRPVVDIAFHEPNTPVECELLQHKGATYPIGSGAYLNFLVMGTVGAAAAIAPRALLTFARA